MMFIALASVAITVSLLTAFFAVLWETYKTLTQWE